MVAQFPLTALQKLLIEGFDLIPQDWALTPLLGNKAPYRTAWQHETPLTRPQIIAEIESGKAKGYGIRTGAVSGGIVALDFDGASAMQKALSLSGGELLPDTVSFTSNRPGREQRLYLIPQEYWGAIKTTKIKTGVIGDDGKPEQLELRWDGCQSVVPPSVHPMTGHYRWRRSPQEVAIALAPMWIIQLMRAEPEPTHEPERYPTSYTRKLRTGEEWTNEEWALSYLSALNPYRADDYDDWLAVGMALHSVHDSLLTEWDNWSHQSPKYTPGCCEKKWKSFKREGVAIGTLAHMAKQDGWRSPFERSDQNTLPSGIGFSDRAHEATKSAKKLSLKEAVVKAREILTAESDELTANIKLEEIREVCGMSSYDWERKIIKPLKRDLEGDRFKLELLGLLQIDDQVERIRQQALMAPKYQMSSSLIEKAMSAMKQRTQTPESKALDLDELFDLESSGLSWVIPGLLPEKETIVLAGAPKAGKTLLAIDAAYGVVTGESYFLGEATKRGKVLLVSTDESANSTKAKLINRGFRRGDKNSIKVLPTWDISQMGALEALLEDFRPDLVIIDSLRRINKGSEISENSAEFADAIYTLKETLERYGASGILIHHTNKDREALGVHRLRGSSAIAGAVWGTWQLDQIPKPDPNNKKKLIIDPKDPTRTLSVFARDIEGQSLTIELNPENSSWAKLGEVGDSEEAITERDTLQTRISKLLGIPAHAHGLSGSEIIECLDDADVEKRSVYNCLNRMVTKRLITCKPAPGDKRYNIYSLPNCHTPERSAANCHTPETSPPPPSPPPTDPDDDYYSESITTYGIEDSHQNSHHPQKISHHPNVEIPNDDYSNADAVSDSEIVITCPALGEGGGVENSNPVTVKSVTVVAEAIAPDPWEEKYTVINVDAGGWGEIVRKGEAIAPTPANVDAAECENPVTPVEESLEATELSTPVETPQTITAKPVVEATAAASKAVPSTQPRQLPPVGARILIFAGEYKGVGIVRYLKGGMVWANPESKPHKPEHGYLSGDYRVLCDDASTLAIAPTAAIEESLEATELSTPVETPQTITTKPTTKVVAVPDDEWKEGDRVVVDASDLPESLKRFDGRQGVVEAVTVSSCLVLFADDEIMHIPFRGLRRG